MDSKVRLHIAGPLGAGQPAALTRDQAHYLSGVMRLASGDTLTAFDGATGAWRARIGAVSKRGGHVDIEAQVAPQRDPPDLWLLFAPIKKARTDFIVEKATELGCARILPVSTRRTNAERIRRDRLQAHAVEAAEQCGGTFVPEVAQIASLATLLDEWPAGRALIFCDEALSGDTIWSDGSGIEDGNDPEVRAAMDTCSTEGASGGNANVGHLNGGGDMEPPDPAAGAPDTAVASNVGHLTGRDAVRPLLMVESDPKASQASDTSSRYGPSETGVSGTVPEARLPAPEASAGHPPTPLPPAPAAILIGPEGGFAPEERARLRAMPQTTAISLGPRILRADTAAVAALTLWQAARGDWG